jgi:hypothetical protein
VAAINQTPALLRQSLTRERRFAAGVAGLIPTGTGRMASRRKRKSTHPKRTSLWSHRVTRESDALDLKHGLFTLRDPKKIAASLKRSAECSRRRKSDPYRSAMSMLTFYINRGGKNLSASRKKILRRAKDELREQFGRA